jgi:hypothetical protein
MLIFFLVLLFYGARHVDKTPQGTSLIQTASTAVEFVSIELVARAVSESELSKNVKKIKVTHNFAYAIMHGDVTPAIRINFD